MNQEKNNQSQNNILNNKQSQNNYGLNNSFKQNTIMNQTMNNNVPQNNIYPQQDSQNIISYNNENTNQKKSKFVIIGLILVIVVLLLVGIMLFSSGNKSGAIFEQEQELKIKSDYVDINLKVESVERNVKLTDMFGEEKKFTKIKLSIENNDKEEFNSYFVTFKLLDQNHNKIDETGCWDGLFMKLYEVDDGIKTEIPPNSTEVGYLYCDDDKNLGNILQIVSYTKFDEEAIKKGQIKSTDYDEFYITLK